MQIMSNNLYLRWGPEYCGYMPGGQTRFPCVIAFKFDYCTYNLSLMSKLKMRCTGFTISSLTEEIDPKT